MDVTDLLGVADALAVRPTDEVVAAVQGRARRGARRRRAVVGTLTVVGLTAFVTGAVLAPGGRDRGTLSPRVDAAADLPGYVPAGSTLLSDVTAGGTTTLTFDDLVVVEAAVPLPPAAGTIETVTVGGLPGTITTGAGTVAVDVTVGARSIRVSSNSLGRDELVRVAASVPA